MRLVMFAVGVIAGLSGSALAQNNTNQPPAGTNAKQGITGPEAPVGHRQPKPKDLPANVLQNDPGEKQFMECCWCLWKADGIELVAPFIDAAFNILPEKSRSVLFQRMVTIVYVAQDSESNRRVAVT